jgi:UDP-N-acetylmuramate-alanine ligase
MPIPGISSAPFVHAANQAHGSEKFVHTGDLEQTLPVIEQLIQPGDLILFMGAGSITKLAPSLTEVLQQAASHTLACPMPQAAELPL